MRNIEKEQQANGMNDRNNIISQDKIIEKAINTKKSINAYFRGEITISELRSRGIKFA